MLEYSNTVSTMWAPQVSSEVMPYVLAIIVPHFFFHFCFVVKQVYWAIFFNTKDSILYILYLLIALSIESN